jgi:transposase
MYLRHSNIYKDGKNHVYWRLVRSVRNGKKVRQETVAQLGELDEEGRVRARQLVQQLGGHRELPGLFDPPLEKEVVEVRLNEVRMERVRRFGDVWVGTKLWRMAKFDQFFEENLSRGAEDIPWWTMAELLTIARLCEPSSELHIAENWLRKTALPNLLGINEAQVDDNRLYRSLDQILPMKAALERHLKRQWDDLFGISYDILLYDITSTYFEGEMKRNPEAQRGHSRDHRSDCRQVCIGLVVTREGHPLGYEVFPGNLHDSKTVKTMIDMLEARYGKADRVWVMDRGMVSDDLLAWMRETGRSYVVGCPKSELKKHKDVITKSKGWRPLRSGVKVRFAVVSTDHAETLLLCQSEDRRQKERAIHELFAKRIEDSLKRLKRRIERSQKVISLKAAERQLGRMLQRNQRSARLFQITCDSTDGHPSGIHLQWKKDAQEQAWMEQSEGCYVLRTTRRDWTEEEVWKTYIQLTQVENAFRTQKSQLCIRPIFHQKKERTQAHIFVCFLAFVLWKLLEQWQSRAGLGNSPRTILNELAQVQSGDVVLPTMTGEQIRLRCIVRPEKSLQFILQRLGIDLPRRIKIPGYVPKM